MDTQELQAALAAAKAGDPEGYQKLLNGFGNRLYGYFLRATGRHHDAEDLLSETMLRVVKTLKSYSEQGRFEPWLFRIAANLVRDRLRRGKARPAPQSLSAAGASGRRLVDRLPAGGDAADTRLIAAEAAEALHAALGKLDALTRQMLLLRFFGELSFKDIAAACDCPLGTALAKVHRGLRALRGLLGANDDAG